jgi:ABC-type nitrate/sulfonate/bicarbonate transport system substrate-binding protein
VPAPTTAAAAPAAPGAATGAATTTANLTAVCGPKIVVQSNWFPQPEHGAFYQLAGNEGTTDKDKGTYTGTIKGTQTELEVRFGGPFVGNQQVTAQMYADKSIDLGFVSTDVAIQNFGKLPTVAVVAPLQINPQILMWAADKYDFKTFDDIGKSNAKLLAFEGSAWLDFLTARGYIKPDQIDKSYTGSPDRFIAEGDAMQAGFVSAEPYKYENEIAPWGGKKIGFLLLNDAGYPIYSQPLAVRPDTLESKRDCLKAFVPLVQQAQIDYVRDPAPVNTNLIKVAKDLASTWILTPGGVEDATKKMLAYKIVANGPDGTLGSFETARVQNVIEILDPIFQARRAPNFQAGLKPSDIVTNEFIDPSIHL